MKGVKDFLEGVRTSSDFSLLAGIGYAFCVPFYQWLPSALMIIWALSSLIARDRFKSVKRPLLLPFGIYLIYLVSFMIAPSNDFGILERKLSLVAFPLIFQLRNYDPNERFQLLRSFIYGVLVSGLVCIFIAIGRSITITDTIAFQPEVIKGKGFIESILYGGNYFFGRFFSYFHQTVYYSFYICAGITILLFYNDLIKNQKFRWALIGFFLALIFLVSNKASFIALAGVLFFYVLFYTKQLLKKGVLVAILILSAILFIKTNPRFNESFRKISAGEFALDKDARYDYSTRLLSWDASLKLIFKKPISGYGVAKAQEWLDREYEQLGYRFPLREHFNSHNQFLQFWLESGIVGIISWCLIFVALLYHSIQFTLANRYFMMSFTLILFVNSLFESVMNRFSGISFIAFLICYILSNPNTNRSS